MIEHFQNILNDYQEAYNQDITNHPMARLINQVLSEIISNIIVDKERYSVKGSSSAGNWSTTPWIAILDVLITNTAQSGYYPVFLFRDDMSGFYLSLNQGVTEIIAKYKRGAKQVLKIKADDFRAQLHSTSGSFDKKKINLKKLSSTKSQLPSFYEAGNIIAKFYSAYNLPQDSELRKDILEMLNLYEILSYNEGLPTTQAEIENDEAKYKGYEDLKKFRLHKRIERNIYLSKKVKKVQGYTCKACSLNFEKLYGEIGKKFIEAHHLKPISRLSGAKVELDIRTDFTVLCSNCHGMIHRLEDPSNLDELKRIIVLNRKLAL